MSSSSYAIITPTFRTTKKTSGVTIRTMSWFLLHSLSLSTTVHAGEAAARQYQLRGLRGPETAEAPVAETSEQEGDSGMDNIVYPSFCVSDGGRVGAEWNTTDPSEGASIADWINSGERCCAKSCLWHQSGTGYANCQCGPSSSSSSSSSAPESTRPTTCISDGGSVNLSFFLQVGEYAAAGLGSRTNFCCSKHCEVATAGSSLTLVTLFDENGEQLIDEQSGEPINEGWADRYERCVCGVPTPTAFSMYQNTSPSPISDDALLEAEQLVMDSLLDGETRPSQVAGEVANSP